jgi:hypothetical protein
MNLETLAASTLAAEWKMLEFLSAEYKVLEPLSAEPHGVIRGPKDELHPASIVLVLSQEIFESFLLLELGRQLGSFLEEPLTLLHRQVFGPFFRFVSKTNDVAFRSEYPAPYDVLRRSFRKFAFVFDARVPERSRVPEVLIDYPRVVRRSFERILLLQLRMIGEFGLHTYFDAVNYWPEWYWTRSIHSDLKPQDVAMATEVSGVAGEPAKLIHGFLRFWGYWSEIRTTLDWLSEVSSSESRSDVTRFKERVLDILSWRISLASVEVLSRRETLGRLVIDHAVSEVPPNSRMQVRSQLEDIFKDMIGLPLTPVYS